MFRQWESINFARDWKRKGQLPGGKSFKTHFTRSVYESRTGHHISQSNGGTTKEQRSFKSFRTEHERVITARNYLLEMYEQVSVLYFMARPP